MRSRTERMSMQHKLYMHKGFLRGRPHSASKVALSVLLVAASLGLAIDASLGEAASFGPPAALAQGIGPDSTVGVLEGTGEPTHKQVRIAALIQSTPEASDETPEPTQKPPGETTEPTPSETSGPPPATTRPTPGEPPEPEPTAVKTPDPGETARPIPTETAATAATALLTPTPAISIWPTDWPLGSVRIGAEETGPPAQPLRVTTREWLRLALAVVIVTMVAILGGRVLYQLLVSVTTRRHLKVDASLLLQLRPLISWWLAALGFHITVWWVDFQNEPARELFADLVFLAYLGVATLTVWRLVDRGIDLYARRLAVEGQAATVEKLRPVMRRWARVLILVFSALVALGRLGVGFSVPTILVMLIGLTISLAARDTLTDIIAGFSILIDQPFRIGDRIEVQGVNTWTEVVNIGLRTSVLRTRHHIEIIVPNSTIGKNQVINYSYPDPRYRMQTHVGIGFGTNVEYARRVMIDAVRQADFVLPDEPVDALYMEIGDSAMVFRVRWWTYSYRDWERAYDFAHTALHKALAEAGIESPYPSQSLNLEVDDQALTAVWQAWQGEGETERAR